MYTTFEVHHGETFVGQNVFVVGSNSALGSWKPERAVRLTTSKLQFPLWRTESPVYLKAESTVDWTVEFKLFTCSNDDTSRSYSIKWEHGENRRLDIHAGCRTRLNAAWNDPKSVVTILPFDVADNDAPEFGKGEAPLQRARYRNPRKSAPMALERYGPASKRTNNEDQGTPRIRGALGLMELMPPPDGSVSWDWPLSRQEKKTRVEELGKHMQQLDQLMDKRSLLQELAELREFRRSIEGAMKTES
jgi:hypothetical protein